MFKINFLITKRRIKKADRLIIKVHGLFNKEWKPKKFIYTVLVNEDGEVVKDKIKVDSNDSSLLEKMKQDKDVKEAINQQIIVWNLVRTIEQCKEDEIVITRERFTENQNFNIFSIQFMLKGLDYAIFEINFYKNEKRLPTIMYNYVKDVDDMKGSIEKRLEEKAREKLYKQVLRQSTQKVKMLTKGYQTQYK